jgi:hypothetical protein
VPVELIGEQVEVQETIERVRVLHRHKVVADYPAIETGRRERAKLLEPRVRRSPTLKADPVAPEERALVAAGPEFVAMVEPLRRTQKGRARVPIRRLHSLFLDYPTETLRAACKRSRSRGSSGGTRERVGNDDGRTGSGAAVHRSIVRADCSGFPRFTWMEGVPYYATSSRELPCLLDSPRSS